jgi:hypothetical protein
MPKVSDLKQSKYLTKEDVSPAVLLTIKGYEQVNVAMENQSPDYKWALTFKEEEKPFVLNQTNGQLISVITGSDDFDEWLGKKIVLYNDPTIIFAGKVTGGIRVRAPKGQAAPPPPPEDDLPF